MLLVCFGFFILSGLLCQHARAGKYYLGLDHVSGTEQVSEKMTGHKYGHNLVSSTIVLPALSRSVHFVHRYFAVNACSALPCTGFLCREGLFMVLLRNFSRGMGRICPSMRHGQHIFFYGPPLPMGANRAQQRQKNRITIEQTTHTPDQNEVSQGSLKIA